jgi:hypothetical protein
MGADGHHYDVESGTWSRMGHSPGTRLSFLVTEFFLHHEEMYHNTPETQTESVASQPTKPLSLTGCIVAGNPMYIPRTSSTSLSMKPSSSKRRIRNEDIRACPRSRTSRTPTRKTLIRHLSALNYHRIPLEDRNQSLVKHLRRSSPLCKVQGCARAGEGEA